MHDNDLDFDTLMHQKEVVESLNGISLSLSQLKSETISSDLIEHQIEAVNRFAETIKAMPAPEVSVSVNNEALTVSITDLANSIVKDQKVLSEAIELQADQQKQIALSIKELTAEIAKKREWIFTHKKDDRGDIISTTAIQTR
jgi:hypothetical protein